MVGFLLLWYPNCTVLGCILFVAFLFSSFPVMYKLSIGMMLNGC